MQLPEQIIPITSHAHLLGVLDEHNISTATWGENNTRTSSDLATELLLGEAALCTDESGLYRYNTTVKAQVYHRVGGHALRLVEAVRHDAVKGTWFSRGLNNSISEKRRAFAGETPEVAILRGLREELRGYDDTAVVTTPERMVLSTHILHPTKQELHYAGLRAATETDYFDILLQPAEYRPEGYVERNYGAGRLTRATYFHWSDAGDGLPKTLQES